MVYHCERTEGVGNDWRILCFLCPCFFLFFFLLNLTTGELERVQTASQNLICSPSRLKPDDLFAV